MSSRIGLVLSRYYSSPEYHAGEPHISPPVEPYTELQINPPVDPYKTMITIRRPNRASESILIDIDTIPSGEDIQSSSKSNIRLNDPDTINLFQQLSARRILTQPITTVTVEADGISYSGYEFNHLDSNYDMTTIGQLFHSVEEFNDMMRWEQLLSQVRADINAASVDKSIIARHWGLAFINGMIRYQAMVPDLYEDSTMADKITQVIDYIGDRDLGNNYWNVNRAVIGAVINMLR